MSTSTGQARMFKALSDLLSLNEENMYQPVNPSFQKLMFEFRSVICLCLLIQERCQV